MESLGRIKQQKQMETKLETTRNILKNQYISHCRSHSNKRALEKPENYSAQYVSGNELLWPDEENHDDDEFLPDLESSPDDNQQYLLSK
jgi:hypothetical protein